MDSRIALKSGLLKLYDGRGNSKEYYIEKEIGRGGTCIAYDGSYNSNQGVPIRVRIKECYPFTLRIERRDDGFLTVQDSDAHLFEERKEEVANSFKLHSKLFGTNGLTNAVSAPSDIYVANNTLYIVTAYSEGQTLTEYTISSIKDAMTIIKNLASSIEKLHSSGSLYLDIKPGNVWILKNQANSVHLFDFDSILPIDHMGDINTYRLSYTRGFAPVEQQLGQMKRIGPWSDIYSIGALLFYLIFKRTPSARECEKNTHYAFENVCDISRFNKKLFLYLEELFHNALAPFYRNRYQSVSEFIQELNKAEEYADERKIIVTPSHLTKPVLFVGRSLELTKLNAWYHSDEKCIIISGIDGNGKSTLARQFLYDIRNEYDNVFWLSYRDSFKRTITDDSQLHINTIEKDPEESTDEYYVRKKNALTDILNEENNIFIIDDFRGEIEKSCIEFLAGPWKIVFITRENRKDPRFDVIYLTEITDKKTLYQIVEYHSGNIISEKNQQYVDDILYKACYNILIIELISKQISTSRLSFKDLSYELQINKLPQFEREKITYIKDAEIYHETIAAVIERLFSIGDMSTEKQNLLKMIAVFADGYIWLDDLEDIYRDIAIDDLNELIAEGWVEEIGKYRFAMNPLLKEIIANSKWTDEAREALDKVRERIYRRIRVDGLHDEYPKRLAEFFDSALRDEHVYKILVKKGKSRGRKGRIWQIFLERIERSNYDVPSDKRALLRYLQFARTWISLVEQLEENIRKNLSDSYGEMVYNVMVNLPSDEEELCLKYAKILIEDPYMLDNVAFMKLIEKLLSIAIKRNDYTKVEEYLNKARHSVYWYISFFVKGRYNELLYACIRAQKVKNDWSKYEAKNLITYINRSIRFMKFSHNPWKLIYYSRYLVEKVDYLIRTASGSKDEIDKALATAKTQVEKNTLPYAEARIKLYLVEARYYTYVEKDFVSAIAYMTEAIKASRGKFFSHLEFIDNILIPNIQIFRIHKEYSIPDQYLEEYIQICDQRKDIAPYRRKKEELEVLRDVLQAEKNGLKIADD